MHVLITHIVVAVVADVREFSQLLTLSAHNKNNLSKLGCIEMTTLTVTRPYTRMKCQNFVAQCLKVPYRGN